MRTTKRGHRLEIISIRKELTLIAAAIVDAAWAVAIIISDDLAILFEQPGHLLWSFGGVGASQRASGEDGDDGEWCEAHCSGCGCRIETDLDWGL